MNMYSNLCRSLAVIIFGCVELISSFAADPKSSTESESEYTNHLINEKSPYLLQHAHNPVDWYPWREEAFAKARKENKPIFLSVGYSTCHWCHVMERESYSHPEIAKIMSANFVSVKVDREERPDIDNIYMTFYNELAQSFDSEYGGFGGAPKFPRPVVLNLLVHIYAASPDLPEGKHALEMTHPPQDG